VVLPDPGKPIIKTFKNTTLFSAANVVSRQATRATSVSTAGKTMTFSSALKTIVLGSSTWTADGFAIWDTIQITGSTSIDFEIPGRPFTLKTLLFAQAIGDNRALATRKYPLLRLHLQSRSAGIDQLLAAARSL
jgi:hypothetical protein